MTDGDFLYLPGPDPEAGELLTLGSPRADFTADSVVAIPYAEPRKQRLSPKFYPITARKVFRKPCADFPPANVRPDIRRDQYLESVKKLKYHIQRGDIYEINFCARFSVENVADPFSVFVQLCRMSSAPFQMFARLGENYILCASPELFLRRNGDVLCTKPIKGTIGRGKDQYEDHLLRQQLHNSVKDRIENVMAVDVSRNDLSMVAAKGSVTVDKLYNIESFKTVHQMVSTVSCRLRDDVSFSGIIKATFPMASMTGAPKQRAMQLIGEHEKFARGYYSGTIGVIDANGDFELPVLIRSIFSDNGKWWFATGGAITHLSDPAQEYEECMLKASTMLQALKATMRH